MLRHTVDAWTCEHLTGFATWSCAITLDLENISALIRGGVADSKTGYLALAATLAVHRFSRLVGDTPGRQAVDANLRP